ncbi:MAG: TauD/TfdA family dioxygenase, partial [Gammaproteobacteria bacterium]|nr:TauD/TfdA family dioxygenase [Gammaproteobacteria bacterium]
MSTRKLHRAFGLEIRGLDLRAIDDPGFEWLLEQYHAHGLLLFKDQHLQPAEQVALGERFGIPGIPPRPQFNLGDHPQISRLGNERDPADRPTAFFNEMGVEWHSDSAGYENLDGVTFLYAIKVPAAGGETMFCSMYEAWETLEPALKADLRGRRVLHSWNWHNDKVTAISDARPLTPEQRALRPDSWDELV